MKSIYAKKMRNLFNYVLLNILLFIARQGKNEIKNRTLLLIRLDFIGDYLLFRNFLEIINGSEKYYNYNITLCGNIIWKDLAQTLDKKYVDNLLWIDRKKFYLNLGYKFRILRDVFNAGYETVIDTTYSREILFGDALVRASNSKIKIGSTGSQEKHAAWKRKFFTNKCYTKLIPASSDNLFEFSRNKEFFEKIIERKIIIKKPAINLTDIESGIKLPDKYIVIFPGAADEKRRWKSLGFLEISEFIIDHFKTPVVITGSAKEAETAKMIVENLNSDKIFNLASKTSLTQLAKIIADSRLLISNDSGAVHIAAAVNKPFICISNGNHFGRFTPYPEKVFNKCEYLYPPEIMNNINKPETLGDKYRFNSDLDINAISPVQVIDKIKTMLDKY